MLEDESFYKFSSKFHDIVNARFNLGNKVEDSKVMRKFLRTLPQPHIFTYHSTFFSLLSTFELPFYLHKDLISSN